MSSGSRPILKSPREIELMRAAGQLVFEVHELVREMVKPDVTTGELNGAAEELIKSRGAEMLFKGVETAQSKFPFPSALCTSVNEEVVHGVPGDRNLKEGDVVSVDCGVRLNGYCGDAATTIAVGNVDDEVQRLLEVTQTALNLATEEIRLGNRWSDVAKCIQKYVEDAGFSVVRDFVGHGIGQEMHEEPKLPNFWDRRQKSHDVEFREGMALAVEPMVNMGSPQVTYADATCWPVVTKDGKWAAHFEHTIAVTKNGADVLTDGR